MFDNRPTNGFDKFDVSSLSHSPVNNTKKIISMTFHPADNDVATIDVEPDESVTKNLAPHERTEEIETSVVEENKSRDLTPVEDGMIKKNVVTMDTTDKRGHRIGSRAQHTYAAKKTVAQGMMDVALITANANQLRYLVEYQQNSATFIVNVFLIVVSLLLQIAVGVSLIFKGRYDMQGKGKSPQALMINNYVVVAVFLITIINVFVASFSVTSSPATLPQSSVPQAAT